MTIALDAVSSTQTFNASSATRTVSLTIGGGSNRLIVAFVPMYGSVAPSVVNFDGSAMTLATSKVEGSYRAYIYYMLESSLPSAGTYNLSVTPSTSARGGIFCLSLTGVAQQPPEAIATGSSATAQSSWSRSITTLTDGAWVFDCNTGNDRSFTPTSPQIQLFDFLDGTISGHVGSRKDVPTAGATSMGQTPSASTPYAQSVAAFAPADSSASQVIWFS